MKQTSYKSETFTPPGLKSIEQRVNAFCNESLAQGWQILTVTESVDKTFKRAVTVHLVKYTEVAD